MQTDFARFSEAFSTQNADIVDGLEEALYAYTASHQITFAEAVEFGGQVVQAFQESAIVKARTLVLNQYLAQIERIAPARLTASTSSTVALVSRQVYSADEWAALNVPGAIPDDIVHAAEAAQNRNVAVRTVLEALFRWLQSIDLEAALAWELELVKDKEVDPDLGRDLLQAWELLDGLPVGCLKFAADAAGDPQVQRQWPAVCAAADRVLRRHALQWIVESETPRELRSLVRAIPLQEELELRAALAVAIEGLGARVTYFSSLATRDEEMVAKFAPVLGREFLGIMGLFVPLMVAADIILTSPDGAHGFALSVFGFSDRARKNWKARLEERAVEAVRRAFMFDLKNKRKPIQTIERLSFGDEALMASAKGMLDLLSGDFDNIKDREGAVEVLAPAYADSREPALRATEIGRRYRSLMRALHPDSLAHILPADVLQTAQEKQETIQNLTTIATESRRFLQQRRAEYATTEAMIASETGYCESIRAIRLSYIRGVLDVP